MTKSFIEEQREVARNSATGFVFNLTNEPNERYEFSPTDLDTLISQIITNVGEELMRRAEGRRGNKLYGFPVIVSDDPNPSEEYEKAFLIGHNEAIDTLKQHITNVTGG
jgi:hypothetical protein